MFTGGRGFDPQPCLPTSVASSSPKWPKLVIASSLEALALGPGPAGRPADAAPATERGHETWPADS